MEKNVNTSHKPLFRYLYIYVAAGYFLVPKRKPIQVGFCFGMMAPCQIMPKILLICLTLSTILFCIVVFLWIRSTKKWKAQLEIEKAGNEREKNLNRLKNDLLWNIFQEFKIPSILIANQIELLTDNNQLSAHARNSINMIKKQNLLIQTIIKESTYYNNRDNILKIKALRTDLISFLQNILSSFNDFADHHNIRIKLEHTTDNFEIWFDNNCIKKVMCNILYNLIKHTNNNNSINIAVTSMSHSVLIKISASREVIPTEQLACIFEPHCSDNSFDFFEEEDINLAADRYFIELHKGKISAENKHGKGTEFIIELLTGENHFTEEQKKTPMPLPHSEAATHAADSVAVCEIPAYNETKPSVLVVDYNPNLTFFIGLFTPLYNVETAETAEEGMKKLENRRIDLVICDVDVPKINGFDFCRKVKAQHDLAHIPVILLSISDEQCRITKGFQVGADEFVIKPFDSALLLTRCNNLVANRCKLQEIFSNSVKLFDSGLQTSFSADIQFLEKINTIIEHNIDNNHFNVDNLAKAINIGRSKLYIMFKEVTGLTPNNYILTFKLKKAAGYIKENRRFLVSELAYGLGFSSPKYFSQCFKEHFGITPKEFSVKYAQNKPSNIHEMGHQ